MNDDIRTVSDELRRAEKERQDAVVYWLLALLIMIPAMFWKGYVMQTIWGWFITPSFGLAVPSIPMCVGISLVLGYFTLHSYGTKDTRPSSEQAIALISAMITYPLAVLFIGWVITWFL